MLVVEAPKDEKNIFDSDSKQIVMFCKDMRSELVLKLLMFYSLLSISCAWMKKHPFNLHFSGSNLKAYVEHSKDIQCYRHIILTRGQIYNAADAKIT